ncbi:MAG: hypothetical protein U1C74_22575 [Phenylobacterium sp.]|nr:hypothetical protein [Phenylobacterium sp.]
MAAPQKSRGSWVIQAAITMILAALLVAAVTLARMALGGFLGSHSPFMLYVAAVLVAGLVRGPVCGILVMVAGGAVGMRLFMGSDGPDAAGSMIALGIFWTVSAMVLVTANELRVQLKVAMDRLSEALQRRQRTSS